MSLRLPMMFLFSWCVLYIASFASGQQQCYFGPGAEFRGPSNLVPCNGTGASACCLLGDTCLSGNACYDPDVGNVYQYGCTDVTYQDASCPYKCGFDPAKSPWVAMEFCSDVPDVTDTWICHGPESCGCQWQPTYDMLVLQPRGCKDMGDEALVALYAPSTLAAYVSLPATLGGSTGYYSEGVATAIAGYTPSEFTQFTTYEDPTTSVWVNRNASPGPATYAPASSLSGPPPTLTPTDTSSTDASTTDTSTTQSATDDTGSSTTTLSTTSSVQTTRTRSARTSSALVQTLRESSQPPSTVYVQAPSTASSNGTAAPTSSLSTGAKAGIGVGAALAAIVLVAIGALCLRKRRHRRQAQTPEIYQPPPEMQIQAYPSPPPPQQQYPPTPVAVKDRYYGYPQQDLPYDYNLGAQQKFSSQTSWSSPAPPTELSADAAHTVHEMESVSSTAGVSPKISTRSSTVGGAPRLGQAF